MSKLNPLQVCVIKTNVMHFSLLIYFSNHPLHVSNKITVHHQETVTVYAAYGIYHASTLTSC
jgi:hypothetical protein